MIVETQPGLAPLVNYLYGAAPDPAQFLPWLLGVMAPLGYSK